MLDSDPGDELRHEILRRLRYVNGVEADKQLAADILIERLGNTGLRLPPQERTKSREPKGYYMQPCHFSAYPEDLLVIKAISRTYGACQFGVTRRGKLFTTDADGYSPPTGRFEWVGGLSDLLDDVGDLFYRLREGQGGRFYTHAGQFWDALTRDTFAIADLPNTARHSNAGVGSPKTRGASSEGLWGWITAAVRSMWSD